MNSIKVSGIEIPDVDHDANIDIDASEAIPKIVSLFQSNLDHDSYILLVDLLNTVYKRLKNNDFPSINAIEENDFIRILTINSLNTDQMVVKQHIYAILWYILSKYPMIFQIILELNILEYFKTLCLNYSINYTEITLIIDIFMISIYDNEANFNLLLENHIMTIFQAIFSDLCPHITEETTEIYIVEIIRSILKFFKYATNYNTLLENIYNISIQLISCDNENIQISVAEILLKIYNKVDITNELSQIFEVLADLAFDSDSKYPIDLISKFFSHFEAHHDLVYELSQNIQWSELPDAIVRTVRDRKPDVAESYLILFSSKLSLESQYPSELRIIEVKFIWDEIYPNESYELQKLYIMVVLKIWRLSSADFFIQAFNQEFIENIISFIDNSDELISVSLEVFNFVILSFVRHGFPVDHIQKIIEFLQEISTSDLEFADEAAEILSQYFHEN